MDCAGVAGIHRPDAKLVAKAGLCFAYCFWIALGNGAFARASKPVPPAPNPLIGDSVSGPLPSATDVSGQLDRASISHAMQKVADWQLAKAEAGFDLDWTFGALYTGFMAVPDQVHGQVYRDAMLRMGNRYKFAPGPRVDHADDQVVSQTYLDLYAIYKEPKMMAPTRERMDAELKLADDPKKPLWWWCDALFMAPSVLVKLSRDTGDRRYIDFMDHEWWITSGLLYNPGTHLFFRDATFFDKHEKNGQSIYWSRGNGWVFAALANVLNEMPMDYPSRSKYVAQFQQMAAEIASLQGADGLWRPGLLDASAYPLPEVSGSAFFTYGFAWGMNHGLLNRARYEPVVRRSGQGIVGHIYQDGRLGCIQQVGAAPDAFTATSSYVYGVGAFLLAGSELYKSVH